MRSSGDVGFKVQRELGQGRDAFVFPGFVGDKVEVAEAELHVRPSIIGKTEAALKSMSAAMTSRLEDLARKAVEVTLNRLILVAETDLNQAVAARKEEAAAKDSSAWWLACLDQKERDARLHLADLQAKRQALTPAAEMAGGRSHGRPGEVGEGGTDAHEGSPAHPALREAGW
ncbi:hypothetical protein [Deinococcus hopiensis]|uniref:Uncharacterized protein n=1 Tax=Deinococcus hopiensis KR-140 TaxID=695939 RepID=A0A1W1UHB0_9DEIO|nr:hypothetical protein [Deinococcus hopiensis]SMB80485.1 hypothetical protein SAMN00790413_05544 [Deinococcus hopiensis KR-140]